MHHKLSSHLSTLNYEWQFVYTKRWYTNIFSKITQNLVSPKSLFDGPSKITPKTIFFEMNAIIANNKIELIDLIRCHSILRGGLEKTFLSLYSFLMKWKLIGPFVDFFSDNFKVFSVNALSIKWTIFIISSSFIPLDVMQLFPFSYLMLRRRLCIKRNHVFIYCNNRFSKVFFASFPVIPLFLKSINIRWLSVPPDIIS